MAGAPDAEFCWQLQLPMWPQAFCQWMAYLKPGLMVTHTLWHTFSLRLREHGVRLRPERCRAASGANHDREQRPAQN